MDRKASGERPKTGGIGAIRALLTTLKPCAPRTEGERLRAVSRNFFLHIHSARIDRYSLSPAFTLGLGVINVSLFIILLLTGLILIAYYQPSVRAAYQSIVDIDQMVFLGRFIRNSHRWAGHGLVFFSLAHVLRTFLTAAYRDGRTMTWLTGLGLLLCVLLSGFSGYLLPWDQLAFWAVTIASHIIQGTRELSSLLGIPPFMDPGIMVTALLFGGPEITQATLTRFYALHVVILPALMVLLMGVHFWRIRKNNGLNLPRMPHRSADRASEISGGQPLLSWPVAFWAELAVFFIVLAAVSATALTIDAPLLDMADPSYPENPAKSPWYFLGVQELVSYSAFTGGILYPLLFMLILVLIPFLERGTSDTGRWFSGRAGLRISLASMTFGVFATAGIIALSELWRDYMLWSAGLPWPAAELTSPAALLLYLTALWVSMIYRRNRSARELFVALISVLMTSYVILTIVAIWLRGPDWQLII